MAYSSNDIWDLKLKMDLDYIERSSKYNAETELLEMQRKQFYEANPDFPIKTMYMQVCAPPQKFEIRIV